MRLEAVDVRAKTLVFALVTIMLMTVNHPLWLGCLVLVLCVGIACSGQKLGPMLGALKPLWLLLVIVAVFALFTPPRLSDPANQKVLFSLGSLDATLGGALYGASFVLRILGFLVCSYAYLRSTSIDDLLIALDRVHAPYWLGIMLTTALSFIPTLTRTKDHILDAQRARGVRADSHGLFGQLRVLIPVMIPLITNSVLMADGLSLALTNRGYGASRHMTPLRDLRWHWWDIALMIIAALACAGWLVARFGYGLGKL